MKELILGGARSGKSHYAESCALDVYTSGLSTEEKSLHYIATGYAGDKEMALRIQHHQERRGKNWNVVEEPIQLSRVLLSLNNTNNIVVLDCLTLWISNLLCQDNLAVLEKEKEGLLDLVPQLHCDLFVVSNEVGSGVIPLGELSRDFVDQSGWLHQRLASVCDKVTLIVAGLPLALKPENEKSVRI